MLSINKIQKNSSVVFKFSDETFCLYIHDIVCFGLAIKFPVKLKSSLFVNP